MVNKSSLSRSSFYLSGLQTTTTPPIHDNSLQEDPLHLGVSVWRSPGVKCMIASEGINLSHLQPPFSVTPLFFFLLSSVKETQWKIVMHTKNPNFGFGMTEILFSFPLTIRYLVRNNFWLFGLLGSWKTLKHHHEENHAKFAFSLISRFREHSNWEMGVEYKFSKVFSSSSQFLAVCSKFCNFSEVQKAKNCF